eukprot:NODE_2289_length_441_cov_57.943878_g2208_i0.p1 GENE.NODE_2289_length_441_cov_57.943878_g2208_i0~~NODE_2289_length_441_cov_57.943878_g2208_i0.p1  ORF type:complete len:69 (+),score=7.96 NODE_2289_length_441_cov_57.943878_g2208_i0:218-424(+)
MVPEMRFTPPRRARRRIAGLVIPPMESRRTFLACLFATLAESLAALTTSVGSVHDFCIGLMPFPCTLR